MTDEPSSEPRTPDLRRALLQSLRSWQSAGVSHVPIAAALPVEPPAPAETPSAVPETEPAAPDQVTASSPSAPATTTVARGVDDVAGESAAPPPEVPPTEVESMPETEGRPRSRAAREKALSALAERVAQCTRCQELAETRTQTVFGVGDPQAQVMFIGEAPGADEDKQGEPFVGRAGQLLNKIIEACGWKREELYICNILRCRPPGNRNPSPTEAANCREYLDGQIKTVDPDYIVCWGTVAAQNLLDTTDTIGRLRGRFMEYGKAKVLCTYHPSYLLRNPAAKKPVWEDMQLLLKEMGLEPPPQK
ncbi:uracil-DNA glycosylase [Maioricimonas sp. JC845]|uniref:uracil-DNA glycosylase n=1 Tax=Maioricimonas sp. JC845 TaxID=3232138 RepID=UPI003459C5B7